MRIQTKLIIGLGTLLLLNMILSGTGIKNVMTITKNMNQIYTDGYDKVARTFEIRNNVNNMAKVIANLLLERNNPEIIEENLRLLEKYQEEATIQMRALASEATSQEELQIIRRVSEDGLNLPFE